MLSINARPFPIFPKPISVVYKAIAAKTPAPTTAKPGRNLSAPPALVTGAGDDVVVAAAVVVGAAVVDTMDDGGIDETNDDPTVG